MIIKLLICWFLLLKISLLPQSITFIGHRGASSVAPENTLASFSKAISYKADFFELDAYLSKDDSIMVMHDPTINRTTNGTGYIGLLSYEDLRQYSAGIWFSSEYARERIPTLREALNLSKSTNTGVCIEIKDTTTRLVDKVVDLVKQLNMENKVIIFCFDLNKIARVKALDSTIPILYLVGGLAKWNTDALIKIKGEYMGASGTTEDSIIAYAHMRNVKVWKWTIDDINEMNQLRMRSIDGIITDYPQYKELLFPTADTLPENIVDDYYLYQNYPNPFNAATCIMFQLKYSSIITIDIYNILGQEIASLINSEEYGPGKHRIFWNGKDQKGNSVSSGTYFYSIRYGNSIETKKLLYAK